jgi:hypothetical protein
MSSMRPLRYLVVTYRALAKIREVRAKALTASFSWSK